MENLNKTTDHRYFPRWDVERRLIFNRGLNSSPQEARTVDLSCSGVRFRTDEDIETGQRIKMALYFSIDEPIDLTGDVMWIIHPSKFKDVGVRFYNTSDQAQSAILEKAFDRHFGQNFGEALHCLIQKQSPRSKQHLKV